jgi:hypothetical protein
MGAGTVTTYQDTFLKVRVDVMCCSVPRTEVSIFDLQDNPPDSNLVVDIKN